MLNGVYESLLGCSGGKNCSNILYMIIAVTMYFGNGTKFSYQSNGSCILHSVLITYIYLHLENCFIRIVYYLLDQGGYVSGSTGLFVCFVCYQQFSN